MVSNKYCSNENILDSHLNMLLFQIFFKAWKLSNNITVWVKKFLENSQKEKKSNEWKVFTESSFDFFQILPHWRFSGQNPQWGKIWKKSKVDSGKKNSCIKINRFWIFSKNYFTHTSILLGKKISKIGETLGDYLRCFWCWNIGGTPYIYDI